MTIVKAGAFVLAIAVDIVPEDLLKWVAGLAVTAIGFLVLREIDRVVKTAQGAVKAANAARAENAVLRTEIAVLKQRVTQLEAQSARRSSP